MRRHGTRLLFAGISFLVAGILTAAWGHYVTATCGYDCGIFSITSGPAAIVATIFGYFLIIAAWATIFLWFVLTIGKLRRQ